MTNVKFNWLLLLIPAYILQVASINYLHGNLYKWMLVTSYLLLVVFCIRNLRVPGIWWTFAGTASNFLVMSTNGLRMPAYMPPVFSFSKHTALLLQSGQFGKSVAMGTTTNLNFLGDIFFLRVQPPTLVSIGDILFAIGVVILIQNAMQEKKEVA
ncbi:MAG: hypothetical protein A2201_09920 [Alicyclobacillus sp. RIFOXYA1_FULL_53_8]|nr:MAG: hypothetical protein A2201_09920 [Alicyclobacillus sp. RIFOXYA1_FULL_53_8]